MNRLAARLLALASTLALSGCLGSPPAVHREGEPSPQGNPSRARPTVIRPDQASAAASTVLSLIQTRMPNVQVRRSTACPDVEFRGRMSLNRATPPVIYVQGQRSANTCILEMLNLTDVERIEVYPQGQGYRSGYIGNAGGLILIFLKDGSTP